MKNIIAYMMIAIFWIFLTVNTALAAERVKVFELAESGGVIEFPFAPKEMPVPTTEIASDDSAKKDIGLR